jgi:dipeptidyl aminopeptidase/acylaminoacyl peptidase
MAVLAFVYGREQVSLPKKVTFQVAAPEGTSVGTITLSPDGRKLAFTAVNNKDNRPALWVHFLETADSRLLVDGVASAAPFWSPDSNSIGFIADRRLKRIDVSARTSQLICELPAGAVWGAGSWSQSGLIVFGNQSGIMYSVPASGGVPVPVTALDAARDELGHAGPTFLPDAVHFIYLRRSRTAANSGVFVGSVEAAADQQDKKLLVNTEANPASAISTFPPMPPRWPWIKTSPRATPTCTFWISRAALTCA